ncbi:COA8 family protein CG14806, mitochondrial isoform X1 [Neodiprion virginianus]|uniref:COA8 family protein CG14806, mitochondrial isoform X1 n=2 Tax=Neodiprion fabricii TaxID=2872261 RepID=UPI001ED95C3D|nr:COA8 family protein CG14806, mitochondrial isoform X1 [Neodiprion fabricii]XP_046605799.1 COA8 family protein CG14806, mitochondrial isoform X1 [Neodiprion virginianus]
MVIQRQRRACHVDHTSNMMRVKSMSSMFQCQLKRLPLYRRRELHNLKIQPSGSRLDAIGPPDPVSNLRPIIFAKPDKETELERCYRRARESAQAWNQEFWTKHNASFILERKQFQENRKQAGIPTLTADEMSVFYKKFLDKNWQTHLNYNISWYKKNITILILEIRVKLSRLGR